MSIKDDPSSVAWITIALCLVFAVGVMLTYKAIEFAEYACTKTELVHGEAKCVVYELRGEVK